MGKKSQNKHKNKDACEFVLVNRDMSDTKFQNINNLQPSNKVLLHVPKESESLNKKHEQILSKIPDVSRGIAEDFKELAIEGKDEDQIRQELNAINKESFVKKVKLDLSKTEIVNFEKNSQLKLVSTNTPVVPVEEIVDTFVQKNVKITADVVEYNKYGLRKDINPEVLNYVTDKEFVEGVDIFIPASGAIPIDHNRFDIDIPVEKMDDNYREVYDALQDENEVLAEEELEDDFVLLANEGIVPMEINEVNEESTNEIVIAETNKKTPSYKYITKEEQELLDRQFDKTIKEYNKDSRRTDVGNKVVSTSNKENNKQMEDAINELLRPSGTNKPTVPSKKKYLGLTAHYVDEDEYEDYELDEEDDEKQFEMDMKNEKNIRINNNYDNDNEYYEECESSQEDEEISESENKMVECENNFKIEYINKDDKPMKKRKPKVPGSYRIKSNDDLGTFTIDDLQKLLKDEEFVEKTKELIEVKAQENEEDTNEGLPIYFIKKKLDITSVHGTIGNLPKTIGANTEMNKVNRSHSKILNSSMNQSIGKSVVVLNKNPTCSHVPFNVGKENKDEKKLRKKLCKEEKKEKRKQKKELKEAFTFEKCKQQRQIANTNQVIRFGLSVKEL